MEHTYIRGNSEVFKKLANLSRGISKPSLHWILTEIATDKPKEAYM